MTKKVFLSYSSKDHKTATAICAALEARGHSCWMSSRDVKPGENYQGAIVRAIRDAGVMVMIFSNSANSSDEIKKELSLASQCKLMVIPVRAEDVAPSEDFTYELATRQWIDLFDDWEEAIDRVGGQIDAVLPRTPGALPAREIEPPAQAAKAKASVPAQARASRKVLIFGGVLAALAVAAAASLALRSRPPPPRQQVATTQAPQPAQPAMDPAKLESDLWDSVKDSGNAAALNSYLAQYPAGVFAAAAKARLAALNKPAPVKPVSVKPVPVEPAQAPPAAPAKSETTPPPQIVPASTSAPASSSGTVLNPQVQQAVNMARMAEQRARQIASTASADQMAEMHGPGYGLHAVGGPGRLAGQLATLVHGGLAVINYPDGDRYAGGTRNGQRFGMGVLTGAPNHIYRERLGQFVADELSGYAVVYRRDGKVRVGQWKNGIMNGYGALFDADGHILEQGLYADDKLATPMKVN